MWVKCLPLIGVSIMVASLAALAWSIDAEVGYE